VTSTTIIPPKLGIAIASSIHREHRRDIA